MSETPDIKKGLVGVYADESSISKVMPETNSLTYRGYAVQDLCENASFDETAFLLWNGELPSKAELAAFQAEEKANRALSPALLRVLREFPRDAHPMDAIRTAVSFMGMEDPETADISDAAQRRKAIRLLPAEPAFHRALAVAYLRKGDAMAWQRTLERAQALEDAREKRRGIRLAGAGPG